MDWPTVIVNAVVAGAFFGRVIAVQNRQTKDISSIMKTLGLENGSNGAFVRRSEWQAVRESMENRLTDLSERIG